MGGRGHLTEGRNAAIHLPGLQPGVASNPSPAASWRGCRGAFEVGLSSTAVYVTQKNTPLCPSVLSFTCGQILPGSSASMQQRDSVVELLLVLSALILVGAVRWVLCSKPSPISVLG